MNKQMFEEAMARIAAYRKDEMRMLAKSFGLELLPKIVESRNKREGFYRGVVKHNYIDNAGVSKLSAKHCRGKDKRYSLKAKKNLGFTYLYKNGKIQKLHRKF